MQQVNKQRGITLIGALLFFVLFVIVAILAMRIVPTYMTNYNVVRSLHTIQNTPINSISSEDDQNLLRRRLSDQLYINAVENITPANITITSEHGGYRVRVVYDARVKAIANIDLLIHFDNSVVVSNSGP